MRALFEDLRNPTTTPAGGISQSGPGSPPVFVLHRVVWNSGLPVDLWFSIERDTPGDNAIEIYAYATQALARANDKTSHIASGSILPSVLGADESVISTLALTNNPAVAPTVDTSLELYGADDGTGTLLGVVAYTVAPDLYVCDAIAEVLAEYTGSGYGLAAFAPGDGRTRIAVGDPGAAKAMPYIAVRSTDFALIEELSTGSVWSAEWGIEIDVMVLRMDAGDQEGPRENAWRYCRSYQALVTSILVDERRTLDGALFTLTAGESSPAEPAENSLLYVGTVSLRAQFNNVWPEQELG